MQNSLTLQTDLAERLQKELGPTFQCSEQGRFYRLKTPFIYPDGDIIELFVKPTRKNMIVSDLGETLRWMKPQMLSLRWLEKKDKLIRDVCRTHNLRYYRGMLIARCRPDDSVADTVLRTLQAVITISGFWHVFQVQVIRF